MNKSEQKKLNPVNEGLKGEQKVENQDNFKIDKYHQSKETHSNSSENILESKNAWRTVFADEDKNEISFSRDGKLGFKYLIEAVNIKYKNF